MVGINVLSLFDGLSGSLLALNKAGIPVKNYYSSEIDKWAIQVSEDNFPNRIIRLGDINKWKTWNLPEIDLLIAGFPCQAFSLSGKQLGLEDVRGQLIYPLLKIIKHYHPKKLMLENVKGLLSPKNKHVVDMIKKELKKCGYDIEINLFNSSKVSAQNRERVYFTNWKVKEPEDRGIILRDIIESGFVDRDKSYCIDANYWKGGNPFNYFEKSRRQLVFDRPVRIGTANGIKGHDYNKRVYSQFGKSPTLAAHSGGNLEPKIDINEINWRKLTPLECERLQCVPDGFTSSVSNSQRYKILGNGFTIDMVADLLYQM